MRGRKPLPTELKLAAGNPGKRTLNLNQPRPAGPLSCPRALNKLARSEWHRVKRALGDQVALTAADRAALAIYCAAWARWVEAEDKVRILGEVVMTKSGNAIQNPYRSIASHAEKVMLQAAAEFGMTPSSRSRLVAANPQRGPSLAELLEGKGTECSASDAPLLQ